ncbi:hypothetical protein AX774_g5322 [Zancudomyces culisetae]|uniref:Uncharacterized protein n=1 Tax=Zancudomyces culisetae TaxID=1213189 RepID=A0A1R1PJT2_ZANCU|nr:hypothetical protein AX774_g5322 [Zancudomyces culisetae]|eukprot:OMH81221.1 hypothetical protein AX774_g5322 [Zancudomyces culisetae]
MANILLTIVLLIASRFVASANTENSQLADANKNVEYKPNNLLSRQKRTLEMQMFRTTYYKHKINTVAILPNGCYNIPNINSAILDGGKKGAGSIMFCTQRNCIGKCVNSLRKHWLYPGNMVYDIGGQAKSVIWFNPEV